MSFSWRLQVATQDPQESSRFLERAGHSAVLVGDEVYVTGGFKKCNSRVSVSCCDMLSYNLVTQQWSVVDPHIPLEGARHHTAHLLGKDTIWFIGGVSESSSQPSVFTFNTDTKSWKQNALRSGAELLHRFGHCSTVHPNKPHCILIYGGGSKQQQPLNDLVVLDTKQERAWRVTEENPLEQTRIHATLTTVGKYIVLLGGRMQSKQHVPKDDSLQIYCPDANVWAEKKGNSADPRSGHRTVAISPLSMFVFGGTQANKCHPADLLNLRILGQSQASDSRPVVDVKWTRLRRSGPLPEGRSYHSMILHKGQLYVMGGCSRNDHYTGDICSTAIGSTQQPGASHLTTALGHSGPRSVRKRGRNAEESELEAEPQKPAIVRTSGTEAGKRLLIKATTNAAAEMWRQSKRTKVGKELPLVCPTVDIAQDSTPIDAPSRTLQSPPQSQDIRLQKLKKDLEDFRQTEKKLLTRIEQREKQERQLEATAVTLRNSLQEARDKIDKEGCLRRSLETELAHQRELATSESHALRVELRREVDARAVEQKQFQQQVDDGKARITTLEEYNGKLTAAVAESKARLVTLQRQAEQAEEDNKKLQAANSTCRAKLTEATVSHMEAVTSLREEADSWQRQAQTLQQKLVEVKKKLDTERELNDAAEETKRKLRDEFMELQTKTGKRLEALGEELAEERIKCAIAQSDLERARVEGDLKDREIESLRQQMADAKSSQQHLAKELELEKQKGKLEISKNKAETDSLKMMLRDMLAQAEKTRTSFTMFFPDTTLQL